MRRAIEGVVLGVVLACAWAQACAADALPSWRDGPSRQAIVAFVQKVTTEGGADFVAPPDRIATFDMDGTLWAEQPDYGQAMFMLDRIRALAPQHPDWATTEPYKSAIAGDAKGLAAAGEAGLAKLLIETHTGMTTEDFDRTVSEWISTARNPKTGKRYVDMTYQPMIELMDYLRANGFRTYIVSGSGQEFMRPWAQATFGVPPEQVIGSLGELKYELRGDTPVLVKGPKLVHIDDGPGKPASIAYFIGKRPIFAFGNSDGDLQMLQWTAAGDGPRFAGLVHHTDGKREFAYDRASHIGKLDKALDEATRRQWTVVDMAKEWNTIYPPAK
ncbi:HAD family hydrolase [Lysobacter sp. LF1]|uniref:HAD family hydrolase n=1 Tax=Lysobacter stagni TaxID=3045172 RepID=A0ABT6XIN7_9GAMM|nr:HAD family hydrolase [Lysobacter sp. LF1]MDI9240026.1 HAD family hydrolase [Lysobacter sp. LF1]